jgi:beta-lactamase class A
MEGRAEFEYDIALSFAGEDRSFAGQVAAALRARGISVFYDRYEQADLWGKNLYDHLSKVYSELARYCLMFVSHHYATKSWTTHERRAAQERAFRENREYILPIRLDDSETPGLPATTAYIDGRETPPEAIADLVAAKLGREFVPATQNPVLKQSLTLALKRLKRGAGIKAVTVEIFDYEQRLRLSLGKQRSFPAGTAVAIPLLIGVAASVSRGAITLDSRVHVRNWFVSREGREGFQVRAPAGETARAIGRAMRVSELLYHAVSAGDVLAINTLMDVVGIDTISDALGELGVSGIRVVALAQDPHAESRGLVNEADANGMLTCFRLIEEGTLFSVELSARMLEILHDHEHRSGTPAGLPGRARVANFLETGSALCHESAIVYLDGRKPYVMVVLAESVTVPARKERFLAEFSRTVHEYIAEEVDEEDI